MAPSDAYTAPYLALLTRLWLELETLLHATAQASDLPTLDRQVEIVRLELLLLAAACERQPLRSQLPAGERFRIRGLMADVLNCLGEPHPERRAIEAAQNRLFDEVYGLAADSRPNRKAG